MKLKYLLTSTVFPKMMYINYNMVSTWDVMNMATNFTKTLVPTLKGTGTGPTSMKNWMEQGRKLI